MARPSRIVSWGGNHHWDIISRNLSKTLSIVSVDSIFQDKPDISPADHGAPYAGGSRTMNMASQVIELSGTRTSTSTSTYPGADAADGLFVRHPKYFFKDGNVAFLVHVGHTSGATPNSSIRLYVGQQHTLLRPPVFLLSRLNILLHPIRSARPSMTTSPFLPSYHLEISHTKTLAPSSPPYIPGEILYPIVDQPTYQGMSACSGFEENHSPMKGGNLCFTSQRAGASP